MENTSVTNYITREQLEKLKVGEAIYFTSEEGTKFRIKKKQMRVKNALVGTA